MPELLNASPIFRYLDFDEANKNIGYVDYMYV